MVNNYLYQSQNDMDLIFHALSDPTRRNILERLMKSNLSVSEIASPYDMSLPAISKHLNVLEEASLVSKSKKGRETSVQLKPQAFRTVGEYIAYYSKFWNKKLDALEKFLDKTNVKK